MCGGGGGGPEGGQGPTPPNPWGLSVAERDSEETAALWQHKCPNRPRGRGPKRQLGWLQQSPSSDFLSIPMQAAYVKAEVVPNLLLKGVKGGALYYKFKGMDAEAEAAAVADTDAKSAFLTESEAESLKELHSLKGGQVCVRPRCPHTPSGDLGCAATEQVILCVDAERQPPLGPSTPGTTRRGWGGGVVGIDAPAALRAMRR